LILNRAVFIRSAIFLCLHSNMDFHKLTYLVRKKAIELGFDACGFSPARQLDHEARLLEQWLAGNKHADMEWMSTNFDKRIDPRVLVPGAKSVVSVIAGYRFKENEEFDQINGTPKIAKYARGRDYHKVLKGKLKQLFAYTKEINGGLEGRFFVDSAPVMDKAWAQRSGLGWIGKNSNLLNRVSGSLFLIAEMIVDAEFVYDGPVTDHCGSCTQCIDACPTDAIYEPFKVDANRCISYLTIELKDSIPEAYHEDMGEWMFGCDICQDVCPWNRKSAYGQFSDLKPRTQVLKSDIDYWAEITPDEFNRVFEGSAVKRTKFEGFKRNVEIVKSNLIKKK